MPHEGSKGRRRDPRPALSGLYAAKLGHLGIVLPFLAPWLLARGLGAVAIGALLALPPLFTVLAPWTWGRWADRSGRRRELLVLAAGVAAVAMALMTPAQGPLALFALMAVYGFARAPILPYVEATSLEQIDRRRFAYGRVRLWGSLAFVVTASGFGALAPRLPRDAALWWGAGLLALCVPLAWRLPAPRTSPPARAPAPADGRRTTAVGRSGGAGFFAACALMQASHGAYYTFYSIRLQELGYGARAIGALWALAVVCEVLLLTVLDGIIDRWGNVAVMRISLALASVRWLIIGSAASAVWLIPAQALHAFTYAAFHVAAIRTVHLRFEGERRARGQALYSGMSFGVGMFGGSLLAGWLAGAIGLSALFRLSAAVPLAALAAIAVPDGSGSGARTAG